MAKRRATNQLTRDNWDEEEPSEDPGTFQRIAGDELKNRIIKKAKRTLTNKETGPGASPFAAFMGFNKSTSNTDPFSFLKNNVSGAENNSMNSSSNTNEKKENGDSKTEKSDTTNKMQENSESVSEEKSVHAVSGEKHAADSNVSVKSKPTPRCIEYYRQLQSLNESVLKWMQYHLSRNKCCDFTPVFNDYKKHLETLNFMYPVKESSSDKPSVSQQSVSTKDNSTPKDSSTTTVNHDFKFDSNLKKSDDETDYGANFKSNTTNTSTFSFGISRTPTATSSISTGLTHRPTSSQREEAAPEKKPFQFSFGLKNPLLRDTDDPNKPFTFAVTPHVKSEDSESAATEEAEYVPPKNDFVAVKEEDAIYSKRCKLFYKKGDSYVERGIGTLHLKPLDGKTQLIIRADTSLGNILLNIILNESLPMSRMGKNNVLLVCVPNPPLVVPKKSDTKDGDDADAKEAIPLLIRVKTSEDADELLEILNKHKTGQ